MNWLIILWATAFAAFVASLLLASSYSNWEYPSYHKDEATWAWVLLGLSTLLFAVAGGLST